MRNCSSGSVETTTDEHNLINVMSTLLYPCVSLWDCVFNPVRGGGSTCALCINWERYVNGWENVASHCLCLDGMMPSRSDSPLCAGSHVNIPSTMFVLEWVPRLPGLPLLLRLGFPDTLGPSANLHTSYTVTVTLSCMQMHRFPARRISTNGKFMNVQSVTACTQPYPHFHSYTMLC